MFEVIIASVLIAAIIGFIYMSNVLRENHPELSVMFFIASVLFILVGFIVALNVGVDIDGIPANTQSTIESIIGPMTWFLVFVVAYFMVIYLKNVLSSFGSMGKKDED